MEAAIIKNKIYTKVEKLTEEQLLLVSNFVGWVEKALPKKRITKAKNDKTKVAGEQRDMTAIYELQKLFQESGLTSLVADSIIEREDRL